MRKRSRMYPIISRIWFRNQNPLPVTNQDTRHIIQVVRKLGIATPSAELVDAYLSEIAKAYSVNWSPPSKPGDDDDDDKPDGGVKVSPSLGSPLISSLTRIQNTQEPAVKIAVPDMKNADSSSMPKLPELPPTEDEKPKENKSKSPDTIPPKTSITTSSPPPPETSEDDFDALAKRFAALKKR